MPEPVQLADIALAAVASAIEGIHTSMPGKVLTYYPATQTADVQPMCKRVLFDRKGNKTFEDLPTIPNVPVQFPRAGGFVLSLPVSGGDFVWLVFSETSTSEWRQTGQASSPGDVRRHSLGYPTALLGAAPDIAPLSPTDAIARAAGLVMGQDGAPAQIQIAPGAIKLGSAATDFVALASLVLTQLNAIKSSFDAHTHLYSPGPSPAAPTAPPAVPMTAPGSVAASLVKAT